MYKIIIILQTFLVVILHFSPIAQTAYSVKKIRINPEFASGGKVTRFIDTVNFIPLENSKESHFRSIFQLEVSDDYFIILDKETSAILIFMKTGRFHAKIKVDGNIYQFTLDKKLKQVEINNYPVTLTYNLDGELIKKYTVGNRPNTLMGVTKISLGNDYTAYYNANLLAKDSLIYQLLVYQNDKIKSYFLPYPRAYQLEPFDNIGPMNFSTNLNDADTGVYYMKNFDYTVYRLTPSSIVSVYQFIFPIQNSVPTDFSDTSYNGKRMKFFQKEENQAVIPRLYRFYKKADMLFFSEGKYSYILDIKTQQLVCINKIRSDSLSYFLPITDSESDIRRHSVYLNYDGNYFYFSCSAEVMSLQNALAKNKKINYPPELAKYFSTKQNSINGNPVLVQVKFKNNFR